MKKLHMEVTVHLDRWPANEASSRAGKLRARVVTFDRQGSVCSYGRDLLRSIAVVRADTAKALIERMYDPQKVTLTILVDPSAERVATLSDRAVATPRDRYGFRSSGR